MWRRTTTTVSILLCAAFLFVNAWGLDLEDGKYEITSKVDMPGTPVQTPPMTVTQCLTQEDPVPNESTAGQPCKILEMKTEGETVTWKMECTQQGQKMQSAGRIVYQGDRFEGTVKTRIGAQPGNMTVTTVVNGKRIGPCP